jgi:hypothetical protein
MVPIPWMVAMALQADGWWLRSDIIWAKPNPMPESITDRPTKSHEYLFLLTKSARYYYDGEAIKEPMLTAPELIIARVNAAKKATARGNGQVDKLERWSIGDAYARIARNRRSVWTIATEPYPDAHFATFPEKLVEPCILAGTSERGACPICGAPWARVMERSAMVIREGPGRAGLKASSMSATTRTAITGTMIEPAGAVTRGWSSTCTCPPAEPVPCRVLDPFAGSGTTVAVAERLGRVGIGVELKAAYLRLAWVRTRQAGLL